MLSLIRDLARMVALVAAGVSLIAAFVCLSRAVPALETADWITFGLGLAAMCGCAMLSGTLFGVAQMIRE